MITKRALALSLCIMMENINSSQECDIELYLSDFLFLLPFPRAAILLFRSVFLFFFNTSCNVQLVSKGSDCALTQLSFNKSLKSIEESLTLLQKRVAWQSQYLPICRKIAFFRSPRDFKFTWTLKNKHNAIK